ncbi:carboxymuconolactone decarboxylase family protein, partial [Streptomyces sp. DSM 41978]
MTTYQVPQRMNFTTVAPKVFKAVLALDAAAREGIDPVLLELVQIRASQVNRCAYCIDYHTSDARKAGETEERIYQLSAWEESSLFTEKERAALALTEAVTLLPQGVSDEVYAEATEHFEEK